MRILLLDVDGKLPNLALMKLSTWHKQQGDEVFLNNCDKPDKVYISSLFTWSKPRVEQFLQTYPDAEVGGTGWSLEKELPQEIEQCKPDYNLYTPEFLYKRIGGIMKKETRMKKAQILANMGIGFTTRGCIRRCGFCVVPNKEGKLRSVSEIKDIINPRSNIITLFDNNFTADPNMIEKCKEIKERNLIVDFSQGLDVRLMTEEKAKALSEIKYLRSVHYAWDLMAYEKSVLEGIKILSKYIKPYKHMCFMLVGFNTNFEEDLYRFEKLRELKVDPYVMIYNKTGTEKLRHFARWVNGRIYKVCSFEEYEPWIKSQKLQDNKQLCLSL